MALQHNTRRRGNSMLMVYNFPINKNSVKDDVWEIFKPFGDVRKVTQYCNENKENLITITYATEQQANRAMNALNSRCLDNMFYGIRGFQSNKKPLRIVSTSSGFLQRRSEQHLSNTSTFLDSTRLSAQKFRNFANKDNDIYPNKCNFHQYYSPAFNHILNGRPTIDRRMNVFQQHYQKPPASSAGRVHVDDSNSLTGINHIHGTVTNDCNAESCHSELFSVLGINSEYDLRLSGLIYQKQLLKQNKIDDTLQHHQNKVAAYRQMSNDCQAEKWRSRWRLTEGPPNKWRLKNEQPIFKQVDAKIKYFNRTSAYVLFGPLPLIFNQNDVRDILNGVSEIQTINFINLSNHGNEQKLACLQFNSSVAAIFASLRLNNDSTIAAPGVKAWLATIPELNQYFISSV
ncbi:hypothetical protein GJ496_002137 [Pomphorhynchus laevis]|nr:hypothetical protein GJ496_002137 [Pomphorhynchus laevis]